MRGSIPFQVSLLVKSVFTAGAKKVDRIDPTHQDYRSVASFETMESYKKIWKDLGFFAKEVFGLRDLQQLSEAHISAFLEQKIASKISHQYLQKMVAALGKLETALKRLNEAFGQSHHYDFFCRLSILRGARNEKLTDRTRENRAYREPEKVIERLEGPDQLAARIQLSGGTRAEGVCLIKREQLLGTAEDEITGRTVGVIVTREKGGNEGEVLMDLQTYIALVEHLDEHGVFRIDYTRYAAAIRASCRSLGMKCHGTHGFRWNYARQRMIDLQKGGYRYEEAKQLVSYAMKHRRPDITCHYIGG